MHGVAPQCAVKEARPSLGGEAGGRSLGFYSPEAPFCVLSFCLRGDQRGSSS